ncbi:hypothetical protein [Shouchella lonarensis]|uniref:Uncharacterized protein n=1 Tax=Shouchella lonarensis TaxID=1464122 RepID=A0A1G6GHI0_9BACI|nr:hypothetical protein [Shouchella lonarensis]SDB81293.1 hypothetical protein SAMN05421737_10149 [Shouchella lonarensis]
MNVMKRFLLVAVVVLSFASVSEQVNAEVEINDPGMPSVKSHADS